MGFKTDPSYQLGSWQLKRVDIYKGVNKVKGPKSDPKVQPPGLLKVGKGYYP